jgi:hypothetical protein
LSFGKTLIEQDNQKSQEPIQADMRMSPSFFSAHLTKRPMGIRKPERGIPMAHQM